MMLYLLLTMLHQTATTLSFDSATLMFSTASPVNAMPALSPDPGLSRDAKTVSLQKASAPQTASTQNGLRYPSSRKTIYERSLVKARNTELSRAAFAYLFAEMVTYAQRRVTDIQDLERRLNQQGHPIGVKLLDLLLFREGRTAQRPTRTLPLLEFIITTVWKYLFGRPGDSLQINEEKQYMIVDNDPMVNQYISVPKEIESLNCAAFVAGIIEGICDATGMPTTVSAINSPSEDNMWPGRTVFLIAFDESVTQREAALPK